jgi:hypothetical protein
MGRPRSKNWEPKVNCCVYDAKHGECPRKAYRNGRCLGRYRALVSDEHCASHENFALPTRPPYEWVGDEQVLIKRLEKQS